MKSTKVLIFALFALLGFSAAANADANIQTKIIGGVPASSSEFPFIVSLRTGSLGHFCGGSLIKKHWVLTAGHCDDPDYPITKVIVGMLKQNDTSHANVLHVKRAIQHPQFNGTTFDYDFTLLELDGDSTFTPVPLNRTSINIPQGSQIVATTAGWGVTNEGSDQTPNDLMKVDVPLIDHATCNTEYPNRVTDRMLCAGESGGGKDSCQGDSGGPLMLTQNGQKTLIGVVSWGEGCGRPGQPGVYSDVSTVLDWIDQTTAE